MDASRTPHVRAHTVLCEEQEMSTEKLLQGRIITFCFPLLDLSKVHPPKFSLLSKEVLVKNTGAIVLTMAPQSRLCLQALQDDLSPRKCCGVFGPHVVNSVVFIQTSLEWPMDSWQGCLHRRLGDLKAWTVTPNPKGRSNLW